MTHIGVFCASSNSVAQRYFDVATAMGHLLAERGMPLVYGGGNVGLMGAMARAVHERGGTVIGVIPEALKAVEGVAYDVADEMIVTATMRERKAIIYRRSDAFIALPGGFGTLEEFMEVLTLKQLHYHNKPLVLLNADGFYDPLLAAFDHYYATRFVREAARALYHITPDPADALNHIAHYTPHPLTRKWT